MIETKINKALLKLLDFYLEWQFRRNFHSFEIFGEIPKSSEMPTLILANHSSWWDGFFVFFINKRFFHKNLYIMVLEEQLRKLPFFPKVGAFSMNPANPKTIVRSLRFAAELLSSESNLVNIYPQGVLRPNHEMPPTLKNGITKLIGMCSGPIQILNLAIYPTFEHHKKPSVYFKFGKTLLVEPKDTFDMNIVSNEIAIAYRTIQDSLVNGLKPDFSERFSNG